MRHIHFTALSIFLLFTIDLYSQKDEKVTGYLLMPPWRTPTTVDLFFPATIDLHKDLQTNLRSAKFDTAYQVFLPRDFFDPLILKKTDTLKNEAASEVSPEYLQYLMVMPIRGWTNYKLAQYLKRDSSQEYVNLPTILNGNRLFDVYSTKKKYFNKIRTLKLPNRGG